MAEIVSGKGGSSMAESELDLPGERGKRTLTGLTIEQFHAFSAAVRAYQAEHPDTLVRTSGTFSRSVGYGTITAKWWQRGTEEP